MIRVTNPEPMAYEDDGADTREVRYYRRLLALPTGSYSNRVFRSVFGMNGVFEADRVMTHLTYLEKLGLLTATVIKDKNRMHYRLTLNPLTEVEGIDAMNEVDVLSPQQTLMNLFCDLQEKVLKARKTPTIADRAMAKRMLKDVELDVALKMARAYWNLRAERRNGSMFNDFYYQYPTLLNDVVDEIETERGQAARDARRKAPRLSRREWLVKEIAYREKKGRPLFGLDEELAALDGEE